ncbi:isochorismatase family protein [soil metagenome]
MVLVDYQARLLPAIDGSRAVLDHARQLAKIAKVMGVPIIGTEQNPRGLGPTEESLRALVPTTVEKMHFDACRDGLVDALARRPDGSPPCQDVALAGCETHVCLLQTGLGLIEAGLRVWVVADACGSRSPLNKALGLARLAKAGATIVDTEMVAFEWLETCAHPDFKEVLRLVKEADFSKC